MIYKIHYEGDYTDYFIVEAPTIEEVQKITKKECQTRGWNENDCWSENLCEDRQTDEN